MDRLTLNYMYLFYNLAYLTEKGPIDRGTLYEIIRKSGLPEAIYYVLVGDNYITEANGLYYDSEKLKRIRKTEPYKRFVMKGKEDEKNN